MHLPDLTPSDYYLFQSMQNALNGVKWSSKETCKNYLKKWQKVLNQNGSFH